MPTGSLKHSSKLQPASAAVMGGSLATQSEPLGAICNLCTSALHIYNITSISKSYIHESCLHFIFSFYIHPAIFIDLRPAAIRPETPCDALLRRSASRSRFAEEVRDKWRAAGAAYDEAHQRRVYLSSSQRRH